ncbi:hypothetical protein [Vannielia litorea]|uniref:hypothetical protein n=1 Tax=Vannielia litorea TaxID=1217970 RepID=UPI001BCF8C2D|nr:hypothetical protein [Vannielia litorea]MBS8226554.1 hypothetical protein [Vannielia litorea]
MNAGHAIGPALAVAMVAASAEAQEARVVDWLRGCAALPVVVPGGAMTMDIVCVGNAFDYCATGRTETKRPECYSELSDALAGDLVALRSVIRVPEGGSPFKRRRVERFIEGGRIIEPMDCGETLEGVACSAMQGLSAWVELRSLVRASGIDPDAIISGGDQ